jgi:hypothetical protein
MYSSAIPRIIKKPIEQCRVVVDNVLFWSDNRPSRKDQVARGKAQPGGNLENK